MWSDRSSRRSPAFSIVTVSCSRVSTTFTGSHPSSAMSLRNSSSVGSSPQPAIPSQYCHIGGGHPGASHHARRVRRGPDPAGFHQGSPLRGEVLAAGAERASDTAEPGRDIVAEELEGAHTHESDEGEQQRIFDEAGSPLARHEPQLHLLHEQRHASPSPRKPRTAAATPRPDLSPASIENGGAILHSALGSFPDKFHTQIHGA